MHARQNNWTAVAQNIVMIVLDTVHPDYFHSIPLDPSQSLWDLLDRGGKGKPREIEQRSCQSGCSRATQTRQGQYCSKLGTKLKKTLFLSLVLTHCGMIPSARAAAAHVASVAFKDGISHGLIKNSAVELLLWRNRTSKRMVLDPPKLTRKIRRSLTKHERPQTTDKQRASVSSTFLPAQTTHRAYLFTRYITESRIENRRTG